MSEKIFHWTNTFKTIGEADDGGLDIKGSASTNSLDRAGDIIESSAWTKGGLDNYKNNPILAPGVHDPYCARIAEKLGFMNFDDDEFDTPSYMRKDQPSQNM